MQDGASLRGPYGAHLGFELVEHADGFARVAFEVQPHHLNLSGVLHGGALLSLIDDAAGAAGAWTDVPGERRRSMTVDLNCRFTGQAREGRLVATARRVAGGRNLFFVQTEVHDAAGALIGFGSSTHRYRNSLPPPR
jgi:uncharacterized protein (TIGR00369 family)